ncbi:hypothetical protein KAI04_03675 [Candidatus Pacearchaeota archaeon]|nr:hypothetical protein [Candidatus Pacearchaeota archaeon]
MVQTRKMNESFFVKMQKDLTIAGELIRARQDEKQSILNEFDLECKRFFFGKISQRALAGSVKKTNTELQRLDKNIRDSIKKARNLSTREMKLIGDQAPIGYRASISGIIGGSKKKKAVKKKVKKKPVKKKVVKKKTSKKKKR